MEEPSDDSIDSPEAPSAEALDQMILLRANMMQEVQNEVINNILINNYCIYWFYLILGRTWILYMNMHPLPN